MTLVVGAIPFKDTTPANDTASMIFKTAVHPYAFDASGLPEDLRAPLVSSFAIQDQAEKEAAWAALFTLDGKMTKWLKMIVNWQPLQ